MFKSCLFAVSVLVFHLSNATRHVRQHDKAAAFMTAFMVAHVLTHSRKWQREALKKEANHVSRWRA